jgi:hypothetical protein
VKAIILAFATLASGLTTKADPVKNEELRIDQYLADCEDYLPAWRGAGVTPAQVTAETEALAARVMDLFRAMLRQNGLGHREDLVASKAKMFELMRQRRAVFLRHGEDEAVTLFRYDGGKNQPFGYVLLKAGKPFRLFSLGIHRPDPNLGGVDLPFPLPPP